MRRVVELFNPLGKQDAQCQRHLAGRGVAERGALKQAPLSAVSAVSIPHILRKLAHPR